MKLLLILRHFKFPDFIIYLIALPFASVSTGNSFLFGASCFLQQIEINNEAQ